MFKEHFEDVLYFFSFSATQYGYTPLITAARFGKCDVVIELLDNGAHIDAQSNVSRAPCDVVSIECTSVCEMC